MHSVISSLNSKIMVLFSSFKIFIKFAILVNCLSKTFVNEEVLLKLSSLSDILLLFYKQIKIQSVKFPKLVKVSHFITKRSKFINSLVIVLYCSDNSSFSNCQRLIVSFKQFISSSNFNRCVLCDSFNSSVNFSIAAFWFFKCSISADLVLLNNSNESNL